MYKIINFTYAGEEVKIYEKVMHNSMRKEENLG